MSVRRVVVGMAGAGGVEYGVALLETLRASEVETHLVADAAAARALGADRERVLALADRTYAEENQAARISSGSFLTRGMVVVPCDARSLAAIAMGLATNLVYRAADVTLKESRPLVLGLSTRPTGPVDAANLERAATVPGLTTTVLEGPVQDAVAGLLAQLGIEHELSAA